MASFVSGWPFILKRDGGPFIKELSVVCRVLAHGSLFLSLQLLDKLIVRKAGLLSGSCHFPPGGCLDENGDYFWQGQQLLNSLFRD